MRSLITCILLTLTTVSLAYGHDYWLESDSVSASAAIRLYFGENFSEGVEKPLQTDRTISLKAVTSRRKPQALPKINGSRPVAVVQKAFDGTTLVAMERSSGKTRFGRSRFIQQATVEGYQFAANEPPLEARSIYETHTRYLKTLFQRGKNVTQPALAPIGHRYEIVVLAHPYNKKITELPVQILFRGKPLVNTKVRAEQRINGALKLQQATTGKDGTAVFMLQQKGDWLIRSVTIEKSSSSPSDYNSYWTSLTFRY